MHQIVNPFLPLLPDVQIPDLDEEYRITLAKLASIRHHREQFEADARRSRRHHAVGRFSYPDPIQREIIRHEQEVAFAQYQRDQMQAIARLQLARERRFALAQQQREAAHYHHQLARHEAREQQRRIAAARQACYAQERVRRHVARNGHHGNVFEGIVDMFEAVVGKDMDQVPTAMPDHKGVDKTDKTSTPDSCGQATSASASAQPAVPAKSGTADRSTGSTDAAPLAADDSQRRHGDASNTEQSGFPEDINDILSHFLGLRLEPLSSTSSNVGHQETAKKNGVPEGLNDFLARYGIQFEPLDVEKELTEAKTTDAEPSIPSSDPIVVTEQTMQKATSEQTMPKMTSEPTVVDTHPEKPVVNATLSPSTNAPASEKRQAPVTAFLNDLTDIPPFVRGILTNVECAVAERIEGKKRYSRRDLKGKAVGKGEKTTSATPGPRVSEEVSVPVHESQVEEESAPSQASNESLNSTSSIDKLNKMSTELVTLKSSFIFPDRLVFSKVLTGDATPSLLFNRANSLYHAQANKLLQLLLQADSVSSGGDKDVRMRRKAVVKDVEGAIEELEKRKDGLWSETKERREKGEESEDEVARSSGSSAIDAEEIPPTHASDAEADVRATNQSLAVDEQKLEAAEDHAVEVDGTEVSGGSDVRKVPIEIAEVVDADHKDEDKEDKEEGYEVI
ncbi:MAG: hypothetical protein TREMPRED_003441 [Tremellales sp. Tagirdzhanova-0007]|nr:MAG: hypothetical protein TREMPRED_003441 [Tremellales sp. Tagirdzhanova-0007]